MRLIIGSYRRREHIEACMALIDSTSRASMSTSRRAAILEELEELEQHPAALDGGTDSFDEADDDPYHPTEFIHEDHEF